MLRKKNIQLIELQFYINNIARCLGIVYILSARIKYHQLNIIIKCSTFLQVYYLQITTTFNNPLILKLKQSNIQAHLYTTYNYTHQDSGILSISEQYPTQSLFLTMSPSTKFSTKIKETIA